MMKDYVIKVTKESLPVAEAILQELGYASDAEWNDIVRPQIEGVQFFQGIWIHARKGKYGIYNHGVGRNGTEYLTLEQLKNL